MLETGGGLKMANWIAGLYFSINLIIKLGVYLFFTNKKYIVIP